MARKLGAGATVILALSCRAVVSPVQAEADTRWMLEYYVSALQEQYQAAHGHFAAHFTSLMDPRPRLTSQALARARVGVRVEIVAGDRLGWSARATHEAFPGCVCHFRVGEPPTVLAFPARNGARVSPSGVVECSGFGRGRT